MSDGMRAGDWAFLRGTDLAEKVRSASLEGLRGRGPDSVEVLTERTRLLASELFRDVRGLETEPRDRDEHLSAAIEWLYRSQDATDDGGSAATYNLVLGWSAPYPETTGYIVPTLYDYADYEGSEEARDRADQMADWLIQTQFRHGGFPAGTDPENTVEPSVFNTGQILFGLVRAYQETGNQTYLSAVNRAGEWLIDVQNDDGSWDRFDYNEIAHSYSSRVAWALLEAYQVTGSPDLRDAAARNLSWVTSQQRENGWFDRCGFESGGRPFLHTIAYTIRGLLEGGALLDDDEIRRAARKSADWLKTLQEHTGILEGEYDERFDGPSYHCLTGNAQMAVVWYRLSERTGDESYRQVADETLQFLLTEQRMRGPPQVRGGLKGSDPVWGRYMYLRYPNWATKFLADALLCAEACSNDW